MKRNIEKWMGLSIELDSSDMIRVRGTGREPEEPSKKGGKSLVSNSFRRPKPVGFSAFFLSLGIEVDEILFTLESVYIATSARENKGIGSGWVAEFYLLPFTVIYLLIVGT